jgi:hypothetical protein
LSLTKGIRLVTWTILKALSSCVSTTFKGFPRLGLLGGELLGGELLGSEIRGGGELDGDGELLDGEILVSEIRGELLDGEILVSEIRGEHLGGGEHLGREYLAEVVVFVARALAAP